LANHMLVRLGGGGGGGEGVFFFNLNY